VNFLYDDIHTRTTKYNRLVHKLRHSPHIDAVMC